MANRKKKTSTKGLAGLVKAPRNTTINGQLHMLAYITGSEADVLKRLGGAGEPGPMGIPSFFYDEVGSVGGTTGTTGSGGQSQNFSSGDTGSSDDGGGSSSSSSSAFSSSSDDGGAYDDDDVDAELAEMFGDTGAQSRYERSRSYSTDTGRPSRVSFGGYDPSSQDEEQTSAITIRDYDSETGKGGDFLSQQGREDLNVLAEKASKYFSSPITKTIDALQGLSPIAALLKAVTGVPSITRTKAGLAAGRIGEMQMGVQQGGTVQYNPDGSISHVEMPDGTKVGESQTFLNTTGDDNRRKSKDSGTDAAVSVTPAITPNAYYQKGVGTQTIDLSDPVQRRLYLQNLIGGTPSPIGGFYNPFQATYTTPDKEVKKVSGLDIFKRK